ncbi:MAG: MBL fold metallo-hydrolase, partial [Chloroflexota bacterium]|nr:MBL fold metallo-hydrolase [Chloroflexota bacterium]
LWHGRGNNANTYVFADVLRGDKPHILIDPGQVTNEMNERCFDQLLANMKKDGLAPEDIGLIINTHTHPDHCQANKALMELGKASDGKPRQALIAFHENEEESFKAMKEYMSRMPGYEINFEPNFFIREGDIKFNADGKLTLRVIHTPGHSPGSISLYWPDKRVLITGDLLFYGGVGRTDLPGGDGSLLKRSIEQLSELDIEYILPGHSTELGSIIKGGDSVQKNFTAIRLTYFPML